MLRWFALPHPPPAGENPNRICRGRCEDAAAPRAALSRCVSGRRAVVLVAAVPGASRRWLVLPPFGLAAARRVSRVVAMGLWWAALRGRRPCGRRPLGRLGFKIPGLIAGRSAAPPRVLRFVSLPPPPGPPRRPRLCLVGLVGPGNCSSWGGRGCPPVSRFCPRFCLPRPVLRPGPPVVALWRRLGAVGLPPARFSQPGRVCSGADDWRLSARVRLCARRCLGMGSCPAGGRARPRKEVRCHCPTCYRALPAPLLTPQPGCGTITWEVTTT